MSLSFKYHTHAQESHSSFSSEFLNQKLNQFKKIINDEKNGFFHLTENKEYLKRVINISAKHSDKKHFVQVGIGGSALGPQMLISSLRKQDSRSFTVLDNIDADHLYDELAKINLKESVFYVVSKSGGTAETLASFVIIKNELEKIGLSNDQLKSHFVFCTENTDNQLRNYINSNNYDSLEVPLNVGGRFSVLTHVGLLPAHFFGIDIEKLYDGANEIKERLLTEDLAANELLKTAAHVAYLYFHHTTTVNQTVLMPYSSKLRDFSFWFVQLWAESLGKWSDKNNKAVGITPIPAYGATDQHSQTQLFMEGPNDKLMFLLSVKNREHNFSLANNLGISRCEMLSKHSLNDLMLAEYEGSVKALKENERNIIEIQLEKLDESSLGSLIIFFESLTALMGEYLEVDPFNQPGVEKGKVYSFDFLNSL